MQVPVELVEADLALVAEQLAHLDVEGPDDDVDEADLALRDGRGVPVEEGRDLLRLGVGVGVGFGLGFRFGFGLGPGLGLELVSVSALELRFGLGLG